jgi:Spy/CpxP family protein refolding chaperone
MNRMSKIKIGLYLTAIFAAGFVTGVVVTVQVARHMMPGQEQIVARWCKELQSKLSLTPAQVEKIRPIINDTVSEFKGQMYADIMRDLSNCNVRVEAELTPEQKLKYEEEEKKREEMVRTLFGSGTNGVEKKP